MSPRRAAASTTAPTATVVAAAVASTTPPAGPFVAVVISALDEEGSIESVLHSLPDTVTGLEVLTVVVDDGSSDRTAATAELSGAVVARHPRNLGQGEGMRTGFAVAAALGAEVVVTMDADGQHDPAQLPALVAPVVEGLADYVQGSRFLGTYDDAGGARHVGIKGFNLLLNTLASTHVTDCTNGYRAIRASVVAQLRLVEDRFPAAEMLMEASARGVRIAEVPVHVRSRHAGKSRKPPGLRYPAGFLGVILRSWFRTRSTRGARPRAASVP